MFELEIQANTILKKMLSDRGYALEPDSKEDFTLRGTKEKHKIISFICNEKKLSIQAKAPKKTWLDKKVVQAILNCRMFS